MPGAGAELVARGHGLRQRDHVQLSRDCQLRDPNNFFVPDTPSGWMSPFFEPGPSSSFGVEPKEPDFAKKNQNLFTTAYSERFQNQAYEALSQGLIY